MEECIEGYRTYSYTFLFIFSNLKIHLRILFIPSGKRNCLENFSNLKKCFKLFSDKFSGFILLIVVHMVICKTAFIHISLTFQSKELIP